VKLVASASSNVSYQWFNNGVLMSNTANQSSMYVYSSGLYTAQVVNTNGCSAVSNSIQVFVKTLPKIISANGPLTFCSGDSVVLSVPLLTNVTYLWKFNNNNIINGYANQLIVRQSGTYSVSIQDIFGCASNSIPVVVTVNNNPLVNLTPLNATVCEGASVNLTATSNITGTYTWFFNNQITPSIIGANPSVTLPGSYKVQVTSAANCKGMSNDITVQTVPLPTVQLPKVIKLTYGEEIKVTAITTNADKIAWSPTNVVSCINCFTTIIAPTVTTTITATVFNNLNCSSYDTMLVIVSCDPKFLFVPNLFSPNSDGENDFFYPRAKFDAFIPLMQVYNRLGELVFEKKDFKANNEQDSWNGFFKGSLADPGVYRYFIKATCADGTLFDYKGDVTMIH
jgi:gliding motility-associated-like protein